MNQSLSIDHTPHIWNVEVDSKYVRELSFLCDRHHNCYNKIMETLILNPDVPVGSGRVSALKGKIYRGGWEYRESIGRVTLRLYYRPVTVNHTVHVYYVGPKPNVIPPPELPRSSDVGHWKGKKGMARRR
jgi:mRNA-degrading endonuclease RelE of RelBE toxin-antitoxin system